MINSQVEGSKRGLFSYVPVSFQDPVLSESVLGLSTTDGTDEH